MKCRICGLELELMTLAEVFTYGDRCRECWESEEALEAACAGIGGPVVAHGPEDLAGRILAAVDRVYKLPRQVEGTLRNLIPSGAGGVPTPGHMVGTVCHCRPCVGVYCPACNRRQEWEGAEGCLVCGGRGVVRWDGVVRGQTLIVLHHDPGTRPTCVLCQDQKQEDPK